jgi:hypothetical protein
MGTRRIKHRKSTRGRTVKLDPESMDMMQQQLQAFREKFGREPGPDDPIFFDLMPTLHSRFVWRSSSKNRQRPWWRLAYAPRSSMHIGKQVA